MTTTSDPYNDHLASLMKFCTEFAEEISVPNEDPFQSVLIENFDTVDQLPKGSVIGVAAYTIDIDEHLVTARCMIGIGTENDLNTFRLRAAMGKLVNRLLPTKRIEVVEAESGVHLGQMTIENGVRTMPSTGDSGRTMKYVAIMLHSDVTVDLS